MSDEKLFNTKIGKKFKELRTSVGLDQKHISTILNIPRSAVSLIESGERGLSVYEFDLLCRVLRSPPNDMLGWSRTKAAEVKIWN